MKIVHRKELLSAATRLAAALAAARVDALSEPESQRPADAQADGEADAEAEPQPEKPAPRAANGSASIPLSQAVAEAHSQRQRQRQRQRQWQMQMQRQRHRQRQRQWRSQSQRHRQRQKQRQRRRQIYRQRQRHRHRQSRCHHAQRMTQTEHVSRNGVEESAADETVREEKSVWRKQSGLCLLVVTSRSGVAAAARTAPVASPPRVAAERRAAPSARDEPLRMSALASPTWYGSQRVISLEPLPELGTLRCPLCASLTVASAGDTSLCAAATEPFSSFLVAPELRMDPLLPEIGPRREPPVLRTTTHSVRRSPGRRQWRTSPKVCCSATLLIRRVCR